MFTWLKEPFSYSSLTKKICILKFTIGPEITHYFRPYLIKDPKGVEKKTGHFNGNDGGDGIGQTPTMNKLLWTVASSRGCRRVHLHPVHFNCTHSRVLNKIIGVTELLTVPISLSAC